MIADHKLECLNGMGIATKRRASNVLPQNLLLRVAFRWLRDTFGETGIVAACTRRWPCDWIADMSPIGGGQYGPFRKRADAIRFEVAYIEKHWL